MSQRPQAGDWLLLEVFTSETEATVIAQGAVVKPFLPLGKIIRSATHRTVVETSITAIRSRPYPRDFTQGGTRYVFRPLLDYGNTLSAILVHYGPVDAPVSTPPRCGVWSFDLDTGVAVSSDEMNDLHNLQAGQRVSQRPIHEALARIVGPDPCATAKLIRRKIGDTHQGLEVITNDDGEQWLAAYSAGFTVANDGQIRVQGITRHAGNPNIAANPADLSAQILRSTAQPGLFRAIIDPATGNLLRSYDPPPIPNVSTLSDLAPDAKEAHRLHESVRECAETEEPVLSIPVRDQMTADFYPVSLDGTQAVLGAFRDPLAETM